MKSVSRDAFGVLSAKNTVSKYWGVSKVKNKDAFTVRFYDKVNQEIITFKPVNPISETLCARIAARFFDEPSLYATSSEAIVMQFGGHIAKVNTCTNTIEVNLEIQPTNGVKLGEIQVLSAKTDAGKSTLVIESKKPKKEKVVDHFRARVEEIMLEALNAAKARMSAANAIYL